MRTASSSVCTLLLVLTCSLLIATSASAASPQTSGGPALDGLNEPITIPLAGSQLMEPAEPQVQVLRENADGLDLEFSMPNIQAQRVDVMGQSYYVLSFEGGEYLAEDGQPMLPHFARMIQIPDRAGVSFEITKIETTELAGYRPFPAQPEGAESFVIDAAAYSGSGYPQVETVQIGEPAIARELRVVPIVFQPVRYDPARETIEVTQRIEVHVRFAGVDLRNTLERAARPTPADFDRMYRSLVVNYAGPRGGFAGSLGHYVIICPNDAGVISRLQPLINWRMRKGFAVTLATTAETGTTREEIKAWLQNAYDTWDFPPEYVCLVGDAEGSIFIPCWSYSGGDTDHPYTQLDGTDPLSDLFIGRISVDTLDMLQLYVTKIVGYESTPYMAETDWYTRACLTGDPSSSGWTCVQVMQWVKTQLLAHGYTQVDTIFTSPWASQMVAALNRGDTVFAYRGYYGTSGFNNGHVSTLENGWKMPFAPTLTCGTGSFGSGTSISEAWIRAGLPPNIPTGGIASLGVATLGTQTRYNNCMMYGTWHGIFNEDNFHFGEAFTAGKYELIANYYGHDGGGAMNHVHWTNLMGDPGGEIWTGVPQPTSVSHPASLALGENAIRVSVTSHGAPCADAYVCVWKGDETHAGGYTDAAGLIELPINAPTSGNLLLTVTKHDHQPYLATVPIAVAGSYVGYLSHTIDDDNVGTSSGNSDGVVNPNEAIEIPVQVQNFGTAPATGVTGMFLSDDPYVTITDGSETFGDIPGGGTAWSADDFDITVAPGTPDGHVIPLGLDLRSGLNTWHSLINVPVVAADLAYDTITPYDMGATIDPGESGEVSVRILNNGHADGLAVTGTLVSGTSWITVTDASGTFGDIAPGAAGENTTDRFAISVDMECFQGHLAPMSVELVFSGGARDTAYFEVPIGTASSDDPTGPDSRGYYAFDNTDLSYVQVPSYYWLEIDPNYGGQGESVGLQDFDFEEDDSRTVTLPFPFIFYGQAFTRATICSNGWISMGSTYIASSRNKDIPGAGAPAYLIAPMWDDLHQEGTNQVYQWFDSENHRYIVQWSRVRTQGGDREQNFEVILYDPAYYPTDTGDGEIVFQYDTFYNSDSGDAYCTVGIENGDMSDGVMYTYYNQYNVGASTIQSGRAIKFATYSDFPTGVLMGTVTNATNGGTPLEGVAVQLLETGALLVSGPDGVYGGGVRTGVYTVAASHPSFMPDTVYSVTILEGQSTVLDFSLNDIQTPQISGTTQLATTSDNVGPYEVTSTVVEYSDLDLNLLYNVNGTGWIELPMMNVGDDQYSAAIPGQAWGSLVRYYIAAEDAGGLTATDPANAPWNTYEFWVLEPLYTEDMESGAADWSHYVVTTDFIDQWHLCTQRNHTPGGANAWMFGEDGTDYANLSDGALETPPITVNEDASLTFWHWIEAEVSGAYQGYCYDGGMVEMSVNGGEWAQITPVGGYPYRIREGSTPGPFPEETFVYSGSHDWEQARFDLTGVTGELRFRFRFGADGADVREGWYIDDLQIVPAAPGGSGVNDARGPLPAVIALRQSTPNPFQPATGVTIHFDLPRADHVKLQIIDAGGRLVRTLIDGAIEPGRHTTLWNGRDSSSHLLGSGVYYCVLATGGQRHTRELLMVR